MARRAALASIAWVYLICAVAAQTLSFPSLTGRVVDEAAVLNMTDRAALTESLAGLETKTTDQLVVVTLKSLQGTSVEDYGYQLGRRWQIGQKDKNNGVLLIVVPSERKIRIEVGYGLEGTLTDAISRMIIENSILPQFKAGDVPGGIKRGVEDIIQVLGGDAAGLQQRIARNSVSDVGQPDGKIPVWLAIVVALGGIGLLIFCAVTRGAFCQAILQIVLLLLLSGRRRSSHGGSSWSGGGGSFGGGGASGRW